MGNTLFTLLILLGSVFPCVHGQDKLIEEFTLTFSVDSKREVPQFYLLTERPNYHLMTLEEVVNKQSRRIPFQLSATTTEISWICEGPIHKGEQRTYRLMACSDPPRFNESTGVIRKDSVIAIYLKGLPVLNYYYQTIPAPNGRSPYFAKSAFIHPLFSPSGDTLTWIQPPDHWHHVGIWNPWTKVTWKEHHTDFWNVGDKTGTVRFQSIKSMASGPVYAEFEVEHQHVAFLSDETTLPVDEEVVMTEIWAVRVWNVEGGYLIDFHSLLTPAIDEPVSLDAYRYGGGIGYRATKNWTEKNSNVITSEGKTWDDGDATRAKWCRIYGTTDGKETGVLFMSDPRNYDFPQPMRIWPKNLVGQVSYHFFEFTPIREKSWILEPGKTYFQYYRIWVSDGSMSMEEMEEMWKSYANLPST